jgi:hypothetical protein
MRRVHRHPRLLSTLAFGLLALVAELVGRSVTHRVDLGRHVAPPSYSGEEYYPILLGVVKGAIALLLARLLWRLLKAHAAERAARRLLGSRARRPRLRVTLSPRLTLTFFVVTAGIYLVQADAEGVAAGRWPLVSPWLHSSALPAFAVLSVLCALVWGAVQGWLAEYEEYAQASVERARRLVGRAAPHVSRPRIVLTSPPRRIFGLAFESRPPPLAA